MVQIFTRSKSLFCTGRSGVTPLQLACSLENPDIETVRSFLENGAHPNWKDASGVSAFSMVLSAHSGVVRERDSNGCAL